MTTGGIVTTQETPEPGTRLEVVLRTPDTAAGMRYLSRYATTERHRAILAIEAEARAAVLAEVREGVEGMRGNGYSGCIPHVLALLDTLSDGGPKPEHQAEAEAALAADRAERDGGPTDG